MQCAIPKRFFCNKPPSQVIKYPHLASEWELVRSTRTIKKKKNWIAFEKVMQSAKQLRKMTKFNVLWRTWTPDNFLFSTRQNFNLLPYKSQTQIARLLRANLTSHVVFLQWLFRLYRPSAGAHGLLPSVSFKSLDFLVNDLRTKKKYCKSSLKRN